MEQLDALTEHWIAEPPTHMLAALYMGYKPPTKKAGNINDLLRMFPGGKISNG